MNNFFASWVAKKVALRRVFGLFRTKEVLRRWKSNFRENKEQSQITDYTQKSYQNLDR